jgi:hypothetical protein
MTIIEILVALMIGALLFGMSIKAVRSRFESEGRRLVQQLQGTIKYFYNAAATGGVTYRLVFDFEDQMISIEMAQGRFVGKTTAPGAETDEDEDADAEDEEEEESFADDDEEEGEESGVSLDLTDPTRIPFSAATGPRGLIKPLKMPKKVILFEARYPHMEEPMTEGTAYLHIYPQGRVEPATIIFTNDDEDRFFVLETNPITGGSRITRKYPEGE